MKQKEITVLMVEPGEHPKVMTLKNDLDSLRKTVSIGAEQQRLSDNESFLKNPPTRRPPAGKHSNRPPC